MKKIFILCLLVATLGCEKTKEKVQYDLVMQAITNGQWKVSSYDKGGTDLTGDFVPYLFQFKEDFTVDALKNSYVESSGTWSADPDNGNMSSTWTVGAPVGLLNGTWHITDNSWTYVIAEQTVNNELRKLRLDKQ
jgi:hypothetical protein